MKLSSNTSLSQPSSWGFDSGWPGAWFVCQTENTHDETHHIWATCFFCHWTNSGRVLLVCNEEDEKVIGGNLEDIIHSQEFKLFQWLTGRKVPGDLYHVMPCHETRWSHGCVSFCFSSGEAWNKVLKYLSTQESSWVPWIFRDYIWSHLSDPKVPI